MRVESALLGAEVRLAAGASVELPVPAGFEVGALVDEGTVGFCGARLGPAELGVVEGAGPVPAEGAGAPDRTDGAPRPEGLRLAAGPEGARVLVLAGEPFREEIVMWWNFVGRSHDEVAAARAAWEGGAADGALAAWEGGAADGALAAGEPGATAVPASAEAGGSDGESRGGRFGVVMGYQGAVGRIPAPALPGIRLKPRSNRPSAPDRRPAVEAPPLS